MFDKVAMLIIGIILVLTGLNSFFARGFWSMTWGRYINFGPYHSAIGIALVAVGLIFIYVAAKAIIKDKRKD